MLKAKNAKEETITIDYKRDWSDSITIESGSYDWKSFSKPVFWTIIEKLTLGLIQKMKAKHG